MLVNVVTYSFPQDRTSDAARTLRELGAASREEPGCRAFHVHRSIEDPSVFVLVEVWDDRAALDAHYASEHFQRLGVSGIRTMATSRAATLCMPLDGDAAQGS